MTDLWIEKWRPGTLDGYVFQDNRQKEILEGWIQQGSLPNVIFSGSTGTGKTTIAKILLKALNVDPADILLLNGSHENNVDTVRNKITNFIRGMPFGDYRYVFIDEADFMSIQSQAIMRNLMETYSNTARFILTCNYPDRIMPAVKGRCQGFHFSALDKELFLIRLGEILHKENIEFDIDLLNDYINAYYPDMRKCIGTMQQNSYSGKLEPPKSDSSVDNNRDYLVDSVQYIRKNELKKARELIISQTRPDEYEDVYRWLYRNDKIWGSTEEDAEEAILIIAKGLRNHTISADPEINLSATLIELSQLKRGK